MENKEVFISYKSEEFDDALRIKNLLEANNISCWMAPMCITGGASYAAEIPKAILNCKIFVLILSDNAQKSKWIPRELDQAINSDKRIMPFVIEKCDIKGDFSFYLSNVQQYFAYTDYEQSTKKLLDDIKKYLGKEEPAENPSVPEKQDETPADIPKKEPEKQAEETKKKPVKPKKKDKPKKGIKKSGFKKFLAVLGAIIVLISVSSFIFSQTQKVEIAGKVYDKSSYSVTVEDAEIDEIELAEFSKFKKLSSVHFENCVFKTDNLSVLSAYNLYSLEISDCGLTDAQLASINFEAFERLSSLCLNGNNNLTDLSATAHTADTLETLKINNITVKNPDWLKNFTKLTELYIDNTGISDLNCLTEMAYLEVISANGNNITSPDGLKNTTILKQVYLDGNSLTDVSVLANSAATLEKISLNNNALSDLSYLSACTNLTQFSANGNQLTSVSWSENWAKLERFEVADNKVQNLNGIAQSEKLGYLDVSGNELTEVHGLIFRTEHDVTADFSNNKITAATLPVNCRYTLLAMHGNPLISNSFLSPSGTEMIRGSKISFDFFDSLETDNLKNLDFFTIYIVNCPTNRKVEAENASYSVKLISAEQIDSELYQ